jgi:ketosteroid isomerase-like protein
MSEDAQRLRQAFASRQLDQLVGLMDAGVTWRGIDQPGEDMPLCRDRTEVREVMGNALSRGVDAQPIIVAEAGDTVVVATRVQPPGLVDLHQVITFRGGRIVPLQDYPDRRSAMAAISRQIASN